MWHAAMVAIDGVLMGKEIFYRQILKASPASEGLRAGKKVSGAFQNLIESKTRSDLRAKKQVLPRRRIRRRCPFCFRL